MVRRSSPRGGYVMSPSMRSKPVSESSRMTGATDATGPGEPGDAKRAVASEPASDDAAGGPADATATPGGDPESRARSSKPVRPTLVELEVSRQRAIGWPLVGVV